MAPPLLLAWVPFRDPVLVGEYWLVLLLPLAVGIAVVYKAIKLHDLSRLPREAAQLTGSIVAFMVVAAAGLWLLTELV